MQISSYIPYVLIFGSLEKFQGKFLLVQYEHMALHPLDTAQQIYQFLERPTTDEKVLYWLIEATKQVCISLCFLYYDMMTCGSQAFYIGLPLLKNLFLIFSIGGCKGSLQYIPKFEQNGYDLGSQIKYLLIIPPTYSF